jgi:hypothetical protein
MPTVARCVILLFLEAVLIIRAEGRCCRGVSVSMDQFGTRTSADSNSSGADTAVDLLGVAKHPVVAVVKGHRPNLYFGAEAFNHPGIQTKPSVARIQGRTVHYEDGSSTKDVDAVIIGTGYSWSLPFLPQIPIRNNRVPDLFLHTFHQTDPSLVFIGAVSSILSWLATPLIFIRLLRASHSRYLNGRLFSQPVYLQAARSCLLWTTKSDGKKSALN